MRVVAVAISGWTALSFAIAVGLGRFFVRNADPLTRNAVSHRADPRTTNGQQSRRVLVIDDIADLRFLLRAHLEGRGFDVVADAPDPDVGQALAVEHHPDGVIIDMTIPGFDVVAAIRLLRETLPDARILAASATPADVDLESLACAAGADQYFDKAAGFDDLVRQFSGLFNDS
jgi:CheY-like chemotaxis protein